MNRKYLEFLFRQKIELKDHLDEITGSNYAIENSVASINLHEADKTYSQNSIEKIDAIIDEYLRLHSRIK